MKKIIPLFCLCISLANGFAQESFSFSIKDAIEYAMTNQNNIKNAIIDEDIANQKVKEITGMGLPQINSSFDVRDFLEIPTSVIPAEAFGGPPGTYTAVQFGLKYQASAGFDATQLIFSGEYFLGLQASKVFVDLSSKSLERNKIETAAAVSKAYYNALINDERMLLMDANIIRVKTSLDGTKGLFLAGHVEKIDVDRLSVIYNNLLVEKENIERLLKLSNALLKYQIGMDMDAILTLTDKLSDIKFEVGDIVSAEKFEYTNRVEFNLLETQQKLSQLDLKRHKLAFLPTAVAYGNISGNAFRNEFTIFNTNYRWYPTALIGAKITMPIFSGFQNHFIIQQSKLELQKTENNIELLKKSIDLEIISSLTMLKNASASLENQKKNIAVADDVYRVSKTKYEQGVGSYIEMLTAETSLKESQTNYFNALIEAVIAKIDYDKANGVLIKN